MVEVNVLSPVPSPRMTGVAPWVRLAREPRVEAIYPRSARRLVRAPKDVVAVVSPRLAYEDQEVFVVISLDVQSRIVACSEITRGTADSTLVTARGTFRLAIALGAHAVILVHNHPSGDPTPSAPDRELTERLRIAGNIIGIPVGDHIIIGDNRYFSFTEAGIL